VVSVGPSSASEGNANAASTATASGARCPMVSSFLSPRDVLEAILPCASWSARTAPSSAKGSRVSSRTPATRSSRRPSTHRAWSPPSIRRSPTSQSSTSACHPTTPTTAHVPPASSAPTTPSSESCSSRSTWRRTGADEEDHRRVLAVLTFLNHRRTPVAW